MQVEYINPFLHSVANTFDTMLNCKVQRGEISLAKQGGCSYPVSGVIGLTGKAVGTVVINHRSHINHLNACFLYGQEAMMVAIRSANCAFLPHNLTQSLNFSQVS